MNLQDLVPPLALCQLIPKGEFEDSALVWRVPNCAFPQEDKFFEIHERDKCESWMKDKQIPAPTLQEILKKFVVWNMKDKKDESKGSVISGLAENYGVNNVVTKWYNIPLTAEAALSLWLELKGIEQK